MFINIYLSSKNLYSLKTFTSFILKLVNNKKLISKSLTKNFQLKTKKNSITVLKSPHVNKTAQTQFEYRLYKKQLTIYTNIPFKIIFFLKYFQEKTFADVKIKLKFKTNFKYITNDSIYNYRYNINTYLKYLDIFGELRFKNCLDSSVGRAKD